MMRVLEQALRPIRTALRNLIARGELTLCTDGPVQTVQVEVLAGEIRDLVQRIQQYGMTSVPLPGAYPVVLLCPGGERTAALALAVDDIRHRPTGGDPGDVTWYDSRGNQVRFRDGLLEIVAVAELAITAAAGAQITVTGDVTLEASGAVKVVSPDVQLGTGTLQTFCNEAFAALYTAHEHPNGGGGSPTGPPVDPAVLGTHTTQETSGS